MKNQLGLTILEIILVLFIAGIIATLSAVSYHRWQQQVQLNNNLDELNSALARAQQLATAAADNNVWGIHLDNDRYMMFQGYSYNENDPHNILWVLKGTEILHPTSTFADGTGGFGSNVIFSKFTGQTANTGTITLMTVSDHNITKTIIVDPSGQIY
ncbi:MAG: hypothetical protein COV55_02140 [Candidatus Komeilibacteria bacterium CG11_big_fil_rev_8_21_14_0_20_36_20]|uniref:General secretion pathway GspH domain-containing protein n=1 Tax=Candidatus Komeilibacteria bacterium CG11_big_fil_rev_8_21_14_0_20_36_20 TaxID=1974477 RepID=A0A2H0NDA6_9BACT|nr:MAG: hypothetical protein COV55_02140 [Candidatus Komeilibacteria bacterium CG11_big_fil_rev_8_21_14_0_20_36_20]PIR81596.1 MAG: hypothetical protein COU21_02950 [Candidatus Komeilibacteria bacterium CG10_big_fil_rev_8_21_14_0_10_36_65]PJC55434.1 MAG: hypothetical protein CO027_02250 [Candidatus Komeilibacteria bacterium CG_4_9_14_0_2_um_filter_36_13]